MLFHRIDYTDAKGFLTNMWRHSAGSAQVVADRLAELGFTGIHVEPVNIPLGDARRFSNWLNNNPNSPNIKDGTMQATEERTNVFPEGAKFDTHAAVNAAGFDPLPPTSALAVQVAGNHYKDLAIQPVEYIHANGLPFIEGCVVKYVSRWKAKGGIKDLEKARHFIDLLIELETRKLKE